MNKDNNPCEPNIHEYKDIVESDEPVGDDDTVIPVGKPELDGNHIDNDKENSIVRPLYSVGSVLVVSGEGIGMSYPLYQDGTWDEEMGCHLEDIESEEWFDALDRQDSLLVKEIQGKLK